MKYTLILSFLYKVIVLKKNPLYIININFKNIYSFIILLINKLIKLSEDWISKPKLIHGSLVVQVIYIIYYDANLRVIRVFYIRSQVRSVISSCITSDIIHVLLTDD